ncbi:hypothetical protein LCGC14_2389570 [marine sediment metagenome]|uniref:DUF8033 domain-containing protein n=1 Tax=marine sediment metagenome TaxID=412755 RepID=A0A0F9EAU8_9ZZZZ
MKLKSYRKNMNSVELGGITVLFSYSTPVAAFLPESRGVIRTKTKHSATTTRHINEWIKKEFSALEVTEVEQSEIDGLSIVDKLSDYADNERKRVKESA